MPSIVRPFISRAAAAAILIGFSLAAGCSSSADTCNDVALRICSRLAQCQALERVFVDAEQCRDSFNGLFEVSNNDDSQCREYWSVVKDRDCAGFLDYFKI